MQYDVLPEFMRQSEHRHGGLITMFQILAGMVCGLPAIMLVQQPLWYVYLPLLAPGIVFAIYAVGPVDGAFRFHQWLLPLLAALGLQPSIRNWKPFQSVNRQFRSGTSPLYVMDGTGELRLVAEVQAAN